MHGIAGLSDLAWRSWTDRDLALYLAVGTAVRGAQSPVLDHSSPCTSLT